VARYVYLSYPLDLDGPRPPAIPAPEMAPLYTVARDGASVYILKLANHTGTHLDTPCHVVDGGVRITDYRPEELLFTRPVVVDLRLADKSIVMPEQLAPRRELLRGADIAMFRFGYAGVRREDKARFSACCPGFGIEAARWLRDECPQLRAMGMDVPSLATIASLDTTMAAHNVLLEGPGRRFLVIEEMKLDEDLGRLREVRVAPWLVLGMDSGPCTIVGVVD
jgi:arylformamidase